jgi:hypothetical protein
MRSSTSCARRDRGDRRRQALRLRAPLGLALGVAGAAAAHPVVLLGRVDELEVQGERPDHAGLERDVEPVDDRLDLALAGVGLRALGVGAERPVQQPEPLLHVQQLLAALLHQHLAEQVPEQADVTAERLVAVVVAGGPRHDPDPVLVLVLAADAPADRAEREQGEEDAHDERQVPRLAAVVPPDDEQERRQADQQGDDPDGQSAHASSLTRFRGTRGQPSGMTTRPGGPDRPW